MHALRAQGSAAGHVSAWAATGWADQASTPHTARTAVPLPVPTDDPITITGAALRLLSDLFPTETVRYARAGVVLTDLRPAQTTGPLPGLGPVGETRALGQVIDAVNTRLGPDSIALGHAGLKTPPAWSMHRAMLSPRCTTSWDELPTATA